MSKGSTKTFFFFWHVYKIAHGGPNQKAIEILYTAQSDVDSDEVDPSHPLPTPHHTDELLEKSQVG